MNIRQHVWIEFAKSHKGYEFEKSKFANELLEEFDEAFSSHEKDPEMWINIFNCQEKIHPENSVEVNMDRADAIYKRATA